MNAAEPILAPLLQVNDVSIAYHDKLVVKNVSIDIKQGEIGCLLGPSGCGKSTLLRAIAGFEPVTGGNICLAEQSLSNQEHTIAPELRNIGMVFQDIALFPHLSVKQNITFGIKHLTKLQQRHRVQQLLELIELSHCANLYPHQISGGQQQRVALARALAPKPRLLLLDEPFSGLDAKLRESLVPQVKAILKQEQVSALMVSHDQGEAFAIADKIAIMDEGKIHQWDSAFNSYHIPASKFVATFIGDSRFLPGIVSCEYCIDTSLGKLKNPIPHGFKAGAAVDVLVRLENVISHLESAHYGRVIKKDFHGSFYKYELTLTDNSTILYSTNARDTNEHALGEEIPLKFCSEYLVIFAQ